MSRGRYTLLMGSDDRVRPWFVSELALLAGQFPASSLLTTQVETIGSRGEPSRPLADRIKRILAPHARTPVALHGDRLAASLLTGNWLYFPAIAWRTEDLTRYSFRSDMHTAMDLELELRMIFDGAVLAWSPRPSFLYRRHADSVSSRTAAAGVRFDEEQALFRWAEARAVDLRWARAARAARLHVTSRAHRAITLVQRIVPPTGGHG